MSDIETIAQYVEKYKDLPIKHFKKSIDDFSRDSTIEKAVAECEILMNMPNLTTTPFKVTHDKSMDTATDQVIVHNLFRLSTKENQQDEKKTISNKLSISIINHKDRFTRLFHELICENQDNMQRIDKLQGDYFVVACAILGIFQQYAPSEFNVLIKENSATVFLILYTLKQGVSRFCSSLDECSQELNDTNK